jgi:hypothetical protein
LFSVSVAAGAVGIGAAAAVVFYRRRRTPPPPLEDIFAENKEQSTNVATNPLYMEMHAHDSPLYVGKEDD